MCKRKYNTLQTALRQNAYPIAIANAATCFKKGEYTSGFNKICIYDCLGSDRALTLKSTDLCPLTING